MPGELGRGRDQELESARSAAAAFGSTALRRARDERDHDAR
jgi:hypothetical protein